MSDIVNLAAAVKDILAKETAGASLGIPEHRIKSTLSTYFSIRPELVRLVNLPTEMFKLNARPQSYSDNEEDLISYDEVIGIKNEIDMMLAVWSQRNSIGSVLSPRPRRVFLSHGRNEQWRRVQEYIEKTIELPTLELAQEANKGRTIFQKLIDESDNCAYAVIIMTGDDSTVDEQIRARENVVHEIGYFQGKYGSSKVCLLHEEGVNIPTNIQGIAYIPFPKEGIEAALGGLTRELKYI